ncbi:MAG: S8 family serine peptidase [Bacteroidales bacterium]|nr:S8 family serine peptidase [Bacteroidales bacterium]
MKHLATIAASLLLAWQLQAQQAWWVFLADKAGTTFDPYSYFDAKAIERYQQCGADLYDMSNYPLNDSYVSAVVGLADEEVGTSRWMNAVGVVATASQAEAIASLPFVLRVQPIESNMHLASADVIADDDEPDETDSTLTMQLQRMQGGLFRQAGIDGKGVRIAVFDGGFPRVDTHDAFAHLRADKRILKTWNFPNRKENVYGWNSHGTMTLSCIAGRKNGMDIGLATGAEFLLARTEVNAEPFKEEVWWQQAVEWADRNGANIISSSLGYGKDRYYTRDMDGTSYVARAANMAARKGMLVVNSAGNEADDSGWQYIITPSDADSVLCIGGIIHSLTYYEHISFASFGPTADGRQKPNLCAFAHAHAASPRSNKSYEMVYGTSFSCPLVAGFAACAWQASKGMTNMQLFDALQRSGDLYPYCDYAFGYGVPQASYFVGKSPAEPAGQTFRFETQGPSKVSVIPLQPDSNVHVFFKDVDDATGRIIMYGKRTVQFFDTTMSLDIEGGHHIYVFMKGSMADYRFERPTNVADKKEWAYMRSNAKKHINVVDVLNRAPSQDIPREKHFGYSVNVAIGLPVAIGGNEVSARFWSPAARGELSAGYKFTKAYSLWLGCEVGNVHYRYNGRAVNELEQALGMAGTINSADAVKKRTTTLSEFGLQLFQRVRLTPGGGITHYGLYWDLGVYGTYGWNDYSVRYVDNTPGNVADRFEQRLFGVAPLDDYRWNYGIITRIGYDWYSLYARYRLNGIGRQPAAGQLLLPRLEVGISIGL